MTDKFYLRIHYPHPSKRNTMRLKAKQLGILKVDEEGHNYVDRADVPRLREVQRIPSRISTPALAQLPPGLIKVMDLRRYGITHQVITRLVGRGLLVRLKVQTRMDRVWAVDRDQLIAALLAPPDERPSLTDAERADLLRQAIGDGLVVMSQNDVRNLLHTSWKKMGKWMEGAGAKEGSRMVNLEKMASYLERLWEEKL